jgi:hypothetical protein
MAAFDRAGGVTVLHTDGTSHQGAATAFRHGLHRFGRTVAALHSWRGIRIPSPPEIGARRRAVASARLLATVVSFAAIRHHAPATSI